MTSLNIRLLLSLIITFGLSIMPLPEVLTGFRPPWLLLLVLYIQFFQPNYFSVTLLVFLGICLDVLLSTVIGEHALALVLTTWLASGKVRRFNFFAMPQQMALVALCSLVYQLMIFLTDAFLGYNSQLWMVIGPVIAGTLIWPWIQGILFHLTVPVQRNSFNI